MRRGAIALGVGLLVAGLGGCGGSDDAASGPSSTTSGSPVAASFDGCSTLSDATIRKLGYNPATRTAVPDSDGYFATCEYGSETGTLTIGSSNSSFPAFRERYTGLLTGLDIDKRPTVIVRRTEKDAGCELAMKDGDRIVSLRTTSSVQAKQWGMDQCGTITDMAKTIEPSLVGSR